MWTLFLWRKLKRRAAKVEEGRGKRGGPLEGGLGERVAQERFSRAFPWQEHFPGPGIAFQGQEVPGPFRHLSGPGNQGNYPGTLSVYLLPLPWPLEANARQPGPGKPLPELLFLLSACSTLPPSLDSLAHSRIRALPTMSFSPDFPIDHVTDSKKAQGGGRTIT